jgi:hypothetical protein
LTWSVSGPISVVHSIVNITRESLGSCRWKGNGKIAIENRIKVSAVYSGIYIIKLNSSQNVSKEFVIGKNRIDRILSNV